MEEKLTTGQKCRVSFYEEGAPEELTYVKYDRGFHVFKNSKGVKIVARPSSLFSIEKL